MEMIADGRAGTPAACDEMQRILNRQYYDDRIASQIPPWVGVGSKHGTEGRSRSDVAVVHSPSGTYVLAVYTREATDTAMTAENEQDAAIRAISRAVWRHYHPQISWSPPPGTVAFYDLWPRPFGSTNPRRASGPAGPPVISAGRITTPLRVDDFDG